MFSCNRVFEDNSHYNEVFGPYGDAFVGAIEWLFTDEMSDGKPNEYYNFKDIQTPILCRVYGRLLVLQSNRWQNLRLKMN